MGFIDVTPDKWYYNEIVEASDIILEDGKPLIEGIPYNIFEEGKPYIYKEIKANAGQKEFYIGKIIKPTVDNPLFVYVDGVQTVYKHIAIVNNQTKIVLFTGVRQGAIVSFASYGKPKLDNFGRPLQTNMSEVRYPNIKLKNASNYYYNPFHRNHREYVYAFGRRLRRANISQEEWDADPNNRQEVLRKYIRYHDDVYFIAPDGILHVPFNLNGVTCKVIYLTNEGYIKTNVEEVTPTTNTVLYLNRVFPDAYLTRAEAFVLIDRLRRTFYSRFTDTKSFGHNLDTIIEAYNGQRSVSVKGKYRKGSGELEVYLNNEKQEIDKDYIEYDEYTIVFKRPLKEGDIIRFIADRKKSLTLSDVGTRTKYYTTNDTYIDVNGIVGGEDPKKDSWWAHHVLALEQEELSSGEKIVSGMPVRGVFTKEGEKVVPVGSDMMPLYQENPEEYWFMPYSFMTRAQAVTILNRFRKLCLERFL